MPNPVSIDLTFAEGGGPWIMVAENVLSAIIEISEERNNTERYEKTYVLTGESAPVGKIATGTLVSDIIIEVAHSEPIDVYMRYVGTDEGGGRVVAST